MTHHKVFNPGDVHMEKKSVAIALVLMISLLTVFSGSALADQKPEAVLSEKVFNFESAWEGDTVTHDFMVKNKGGAPLEILKIDTD